MKYKPNNIDISELFQYARDCTNRTRIVRCYLHIAEVAYNLDHARYYPNF